MPMGHMIRSHFGSSGLSKLIMSCMYRAYTDFGGEDSPRPVMAAEESAIQFLGSTGKLATSFLGGMPPPEHA